MVIHLDRSSIEGYVARPAVTFLSWRDPRSPLSRLFDAGYQNLSARHPDVEFGDIDVAEDPELAGDWGVPRAPELMAYRDGTLVFDYAGALPESVIEALIEAIWSLDMEAIRTGIDGHASRLRLVFQESGAPAFELGGEEGGGSAPAAGGRPVKH